MPRAPIREHRAGGFRADGAEPRRLGRWDRSEVSDPSGPIQGNRVEWAEPSGPLQVLRAERAEPSGPCQVLRDVKALKVLMQSGLIQILTQKNCSQFEPNQVV